MSLAALTWKYVGSSVPAANTVEGVLNALYTLGTAVTYNDATTRTPGSGQAGTFARYQNGGVTEAVYATPVSDTFGLRHIWAGAAGAKTPTMISSPADTWATATVLFGISRSSGAYSAWDGATPFGSVFTGYARACALGSHTIARVHLWENAVAFYVVYATTTTTIHNFSGELVDPGVTNATSPTCAEATTGSRIVFATNGSTQVTAVAGWTNNSHPALLTHSSTANLAHFFALGVGAATLTPIDRTFNQQFASNTQSCVNADGDLVTMPIYVHTTTGNFMVGRLREMMLGPDAKLAQSASASGVVKAYAASTSVASDTDTLWLQA